MQQSEDVCDEHILQVHHKGTLSIATNIYGQALKMALEDYVPYIFFHLVSCINFLAY